MKYKKLIKVLEKINFMWLNNLVIIKEVVVMVLFLES